MKRLLILMSALILSFSCEEGEDLNIYHWVGEGIDLTLAERPDGLAAGTLMMVEGKDTNNYAVYGYKLADTPGNFLLDVYNEEICWYSLPGKVNDAGDYECWIIPSDDLQGKEAVLKKAEAPKDFTSPFKHADYKDFKSVSDYESIKKKAVDGSEYFGDVMTMTDGKGGLVFSVTATDCDYKFGDLYVGNDEMMKDAVYLPFKDGILDYTVNKLSLRLEFFKTFVHISRTCEFDPADDMHISAEKVIGFYPLVSHFDDIPAWWYEEEDGDDYQSDFTEVGELLSEIRYMGGDDFVEDGAIDIDVDGRLPDIADYFKGFADRYYGSVVDRTKDLLFGTGDCPDNCYATLDKKNGYINSNLTGDYYEGMQMCYWKTPTDHNIVAVRINYTGLGEFDAFPATLLVLYEYDTEQHKIRPISVAGAERWAINEAYLLPEDISVYSNIELPQKGKDIVVYDSFGPDANKTVLHWNGEWFDY